jgi:host factor-I protein
MVHTGCQQVTSKLARAFCQTFAGLVDAEPVTVVPRDRSQVAGRRSRFLPGSTYMTQGLPQDQSEMLVSAQADGSQVAIFLINGIRLVGQIDSFDRRHVMLRSNTDTQAVYKHAISTVQAHTGRSTSVSGPRAAGESLHPGAARRGGPVMHKRRVTRPPTDR